MTKEELEITEIVNRETKAWDTQDANMLITIFHPDMVWPWPKTPLSHDPMDWELVLGKFDNDRWIKGWQELFDNYRLIHNKREINKIDIKVIINKKRKMKKKQAIWYVFLPVLFTVGLYLVFYTEIKYTPSNAGFWLILAMGMSIGAAITRSILKINGKK
jgi:hypothetical protein